MTTTMTMMKMTR